MDGNRNNSNELYHHGVKGQRWGVRKTKEISTNIHRRSMGLPGNKDEAIRNTGMNPAKRIATAAVGAHARSQGLSTKPLQEKSPYSVRAQIKDAKGRQRYLKSTEDQVKLFKDAAKAWTDAHDEIMNAPLGKYTKYKDYQEVVRRHFNLNVNKDIHFL